MSRCKKCIHGIELACGGYGCDKSKRTYVITTLHSYLCRNYTVQQNPVFKYKNLCDCQIEKIEKKALYEIYAATESIISLKSCKALDEKAGNYYSRLGWYQNHGKRIIENAQILLDIIDERGFSEDKK